MASILVASQRLGLSGRAAIKADRHKAVRVKGCTDGSCVEVIFILDPDEVSVHAVKEDCEVPIVAGTVAVQARHAELGVGDNIFVDLI